MSEQNARIFPHWDEARHSAEESRLKITQLCAEMDETCRQSRMAIAESYELLAKLGGIRKTRQGALLRPAAVMYGGAKLAQVVLAAAR